MLIPIGTDVQLRRPPLGNWLLVGLNVAVFLLTDVFLTGPDLKNFFTLNAAVPTLGQYVSYQFLHGDLMHLAGNMLFLWIFGNAVCDRMGSLNYCLFYLTGGVFAGMVYAGLNQAPLLGASGSIAAVTTAFLVLYPRVHITLLLWLFIVTTFQLPAMLLIGIKIILWDNIVAPSFDRGGVSNVAYSAHLAGYAFGFAVPLLYLLIGALPRSQFDLLALGQRWQRRQGWEVGPFPPPTARRVRSEELDSRSPALEASPADRLRDDVLDRLASRDLPEAARLYIELLAHSGRALLPRAQLLELGNYLTHAQRYREAATAYETFLEAYPTAPDAAQVRLMLGLIYNRYLSDFPKAAVQLRAALDGLTADAQRALAAAELNAALGQAGGAGS